MMGCTDPLISVLELTKNEWVPRVVASLKFASGIARIAQNSYASRAIAKLLMTSLAPLSYIPAML